MILFLLLAVSHFCLSINLEWGEMSARTKEKMDLMKANLAASFGRETKNLRSKHLPHGFGMNQSINILFILADDLGYGDTSVEPFTGAGIVTPELVKMASRGTVMSNFHSAAATCTPTRASILTGLYPWRLGIKAVYEYGEKAKGKSNRDDWLPQVPNVAMAFRNANYFTGHSGKWHLGGMRNDDLDMRKLPVDGDKRSKLGPKQCRHPGPNQQGFDEYVSVLDGPGAPRQNELQISDTLHSRGCNHLLKNDEHIGAAGGTNGEFLSDCEARHAIRMMTESVKAGRPFYIHTWFHAPHGPWEVLPGFHSVYGRSRAPNMNMEKYRTMVTAMDRSIGTLLNAVRSLGIERNTLVVFTSDNGPEDFYGTTAGLKGNKRFLYEGGIRVPTIFQWVGTIPKGRVSDAFGVSTDFFPTFLHAAGVSVPTNVVFDGLSLLPELVPTMKHKKLHHLENMDRVTLWHGDFEGPRSTAAWTHDFKIMLNQSDYPAEMYDMRNDKLETNNLLKDVSFFSASHVVTCPPPKGLLDSVALNTTKAVPDLLRTNSSFHRYLVAKLFDSMQNFVRFGNEAHLIYLAENPSREYVPTVESDIRHSRHPVYKSMSKEAADKYRAELMSGVCESSCACRVPDIHQVSSFPFNKTIKSWHTVQPGHTGNPLRTTNLISK